MEDEEGVLQMSKQRCDLEERLQEANTGQLESTERRDVYAYVSVCVHVCGRVMGKGRGKTRCDTTDKPAAEITWI